MANLKKCGAVVGNCDFMENPDSDDNFIGKVPYTEPFAKGYKVAIVALPARMCFAHCKDMIEAGFERILVEKPGCVDAEEAQELVSIAEKKGVTVYINYQRTFDPKLGELLAQIKQKSAEGYELEYCSVYSCDKAYPPQPTQ